MFLHVKDNSVQVLFKSDCHSLTPVLANFLSLSLFSFLITVIQIISLSNLGLLAFRIIHNPTNNSIYITDAEKEFEYSLRVGMDGYECGLQL